MRNFFRRYSPFLFMAALVLSGVFLGGFFRGGISYDNPNTIAQNQAKMLSAKVSKLVVVPEGEIPNIASVTNPEVLRSQAFFSEAKTGDIVLIYSKKAVLYDPILNKIIIVAPINVGNTDTTELVPKFQGEALDVDDPGAENQF